MLESVHISQQQPVSATTTYHTAKLATTVCCRSSVQSQVPYWTTGSPTSSYQTGPVLSVRRTSRRQAPQTQQATPGIKSTDWLRDRKWRCLPETDRQGYHVCFDFHAECGSRGCRKDDDLHLRGTNREESGTCWRTTPGPCSTYRYNRDGRLGCFEQSSRTFRFGPNLEGADRRPATSVSATCRTEIAGKCFVILRGCCSQVGYKIGMVPAHANTFRACCLTCELVSFGRRSATVAWR